MFISLLMKMFFMSTLCFCTLTTTGACKIYADSHERTVLINNCRLIVAHINEYYASIGAMRSSARINEIKGQLTLYLQKVGSRESSLLLEELQRSNFEAFL